MSGLCFCKAFDTGSHQMQKVMKYRLAEQKVSWDENWRGSSKGPLSEFCLHIKIFERKVQRIQNQLVGESPFLQILNSHLNVVMGS